MENYDKIPDYLQDTYDMVKCAFPDKISSEEYWSLMALLHPYMSHRTVARVLGVISQKGYIEAYNDASGFGLDPMPNPDDIENARQKLVSCGYEEWLRKNEI